MRSSASSSSRPVAIWVYTGVIMLLIQVVLGGITRLTGSGLSITEWDVVTGAIPPLNHDQWMAAFDGYRRTPQYHFLNSGFGLSDYKFIFFWEWFHRLWARMVAVVFLVGFIYLVSKKKIRPEMVEPLVILFLLGALQGAIGWIMVVSGFQGDAIYVRPTRLALHFVFALGLIVYAFWFALQLSVPTGILITRSDPPGMDSGRQRKVLRGWTIAILIVLFFQLLYGALMAGHKAAAVASTWPTINGSWIPDGLFRGGGLLQNLIGNPIAVQFIHRGIAYLLLVMILIWTVQARLLFAVPRWFLRLRWLPLLLVLLQVLLGITSLLASPWIVPNRWVTFDWLAQLHQVVGMLLLLTIVGMLYLVRTLRPPARRSVTV